MMTSPETDSPSTGKRTMDWGAIVSGSGISIGSSVHEVDIKIGKSSAVNLNMFKLLRIVLIYVTFYRNKRKSLLPILLFSRLKITLSNCFLTIFSIENTYIFLPKLLSS